jgi:uncharacterized membrane protein
MNYETSNPSFRERFLYMARQVPIDLSVINLYLVATVLVLTVLPVGSTTVRSLVAIPLVVFVPGYVLVAFLFPRRHGLSDRFRHFAGRRSNGAGGYIDIVERTALGFGTSVAIVPMLVLAVSIAGLELTTRNLLGTLIAFVVLGSVLAAFRRLRVASDQRFALPVRNWVDGLYGAFTNTGSTAGVILNIALALSVIIALGTLGGAIASPADGQASSELTLLTQNESGDLVTEGYPTQFSPGESQDMTVQVENNEGEETTYTVVVVVQRVNAGDGSETVLEQEEVTRLQNTVGQNETWTEQHGVAPEMLGDDLRLQYLLYKGDPPADPDSENAYRSAYIWVSVSEN